MKPAAKLRTLWSLVVVISSVVDISSLAQPQSRAASATALSQAQIESLIKLRNPDDVIAAAVDHRGLAFIPNEALLARLEALGAGPRTLRTLDELVPMTNAARDQIPVLLGKIYQALNDGSAGLARTYMSKDLAQNAEQMDAICKPYTYRAHYVDAIIERPHHWYETRVRLLLKPMDERAYIVWFFGWRGKFYAGKVERMSREWELQQMGNSTDVVRKFIYARRARKLEVMTELVFPGLDPSQFLDDYWNRAFADMDTDFSENALSVVDYKGLKLRVQTRIILPAAVAFMQHYGGFLLDNYRGESKIVCIYYDDNSSGTHYICPGDIERYTLGRFGIEASTSQASTNTSSTPPEETPKTAHQTSLTNAEVAGLWKKADRFMEEREYSQALDYYRKGLDARPDNVGLLQGVFRAQMGLEDLDAAEDTANKVLSQGGDVYIPFFHDHAWSPCVGVLKIQKGKLSFEASSSRDHVFSISRDDLISIENQRICRYPVTWLNIRFRTPDHKEKTYNLVVGQYGMQVRECLGSHSYEDPPWVANAEKINRMFLRLIREYVINAAQ